MEKFRKQIKIKLVMYIVFAVLMTAVYIAVSFIYPDSDTFSAGYGSGFCSGFTLVSVVFAVRYAIVLKDSEKLKKLYVLETDVRLRIIREKTASGSFVITVFILGFATVIATFFSDTVVCVLAAVIGVMAAVKLSLKFYYDRKY